MGWERRKKVSWNKEKFRPRKIQPAYNYLVLDLNNCTIKLYTLTALGTTLTR